MRLIDAGALQREYMQFHDGKRSVLVDVAPTIEERKRGMWIDKDGGLATCSECGDRWGVWSVMKFCPNCGADMRGEEDDHTAEEKAT